VSTLVVPDLEESPWPTLGPGVCHFIESFMVHGPGDLRGRPARIDAEKRALIYRAYEVYPRDHPRAGRRRFNRVGVSLRKGSAKTEWAAWLAGVELSQRGPVRTIDWTLERGEMVPAGGPVTDPYIPMVAYTEEQSEDLAYGALLFILGESPLARDFDLGLERILRRSGDGKAVALASSPDARDGARTTFQHFDETHRFTQVRLKNAHKTMLANTPKRREADAWSLETTTAPAAGEGSVAEDTMRYAQAIHDGRLAADPKLFFFHRQASDGHDLKTPEGVRAAVLEASGPIAEWSNIDAIVDQWADPTSDPIFLERVWLNRLVKGSGGAFDATRWRALAKPGEIEDGALVALGFAGARYSDAAAVVVTDILTGRQQLVRAWEQPGGAAPANWQVPESELTTAIAGCFKRWEVWRLYATPTHWESTVDFWAGEWGGETDRVVKWRTNQHLRMSEACRAFANAIKAGEVPHDGDPLLARHVGAARREDTQMRDEEGRVRWVIRKESPDSQAYINAAVAAILSWQARRDAIAEGVVSTAEPWDGQVMVLE
jgi:hypothetical protein